MISRTILNATPTSPLDILAAEVRKWLVGNLRKVIVPRLDVEGLLDFVPNPVPPLKVE